MRYLFAFVLFCFSFSVYADGMPRGSVSVPVSEGDGGLVYALEVARTNYNVTESQAFTDYHATIYASGANIQAARAVYFRTEMKARALFYNQSDNACLRYTGNKCRWD